eukprot:g8052.t1
MDYHELKVAIRAMGFEIKKPEALELMARYDREETGYIGFDAFEDIMIQPFGHNHTFSEGIALTKSGRRFRGILIRIFTWTWMVTALSTGRPPSKGHRRDSPYEGGRFQMKIVCSASYPYAAPQVSFETKVFHPNVNFNTGELCVDILKTDWSPAWTLQYVCRAVVSLLRDPNADSPLNCDAGNLLRSGDLKGFHSMARMYTMEYAIER